MRLVSPYSLLMVVSHNQQQKESQLNKRRRVLLINPLRQIRWVLRLGLSKVRITLSEKKIDFDCCNDQLLSRTLKPNFPMLWLSKRNRI
jgi:hypothetical protein